MIEYIHSISVEDYNFLRKSVGWKEVESSQAQTGIANSTFLIAAVENNRIVGLTRVISDGGYIAFIADVIVLPEYQGKGIGKTLVEKAIDYIESNLKEGQWVTVNLMAAKGRESFYERFGFAKIPSENFGYGMIKRIIK